MSQTRDTTMQKDQGDKRLWVEMIGFNAPADTHSHTRLLRQHDLWDWTLYRVKQHAEAHGSMGSTPAEC